jgi:hypothetical protein
VQHVCRSRGYWVLSSACCLFCTWHAGWYQLLGKSGDERGEIRLKTTWSPVAAPPSAAASPPPPGTAAAAAPAPAPLSPPCWSFEDSPGYVWVAVCAAATLVSTSGVFTVDVPCRVWKQFNAATQVALEASYSSGQPGVVQTTFRQWTYAVDVRNAEREAATQTNHQTNKLRRVRRI